MARSFNTDPARRTEPLYGKAPDRWAKQFRRARASRTRQTLRTDAAERFQMRELDPRITRYLNTK